jgi:hypothetical protein
VLVEILGTPDAPYHQWLKIIPNDLSIDPVCMVNPYVARGFHQTARMRIFPFIHYANKDSLKARAL